jgi:hypothetical protein
MYWDKNKIQGFCSTGRFLLMPTGNLLVGVSGLKKQVFTKMGTH